MPADVRTPSSETSGGNRMLKREANCAFTSLKSAAPSPKYHDELARLGKPGSVANVAPAGNRPAAPPVGAGPRSTPPCTSAVHFGSAFGFVMTWATHVCAQPN